MLLYIVLVTIYVLLYMYNVDLVSRGRWPLRARAERVYVAARVDGCPRPAVTEHGLRTISSTLQAQAQVQVQGQG